MSKTNQLPWTIEEILAMQEAERMGMSDPAAVAAHIHQKTRLAIRQVGDVALQMSESSRQYVGQGEEKGNIGIGVLLKDHVSLSGRRSRATRRSGDGDGRDCERVERRD